MLSSGSTKIWFQPELPGLYIFHQEMVNFGIFSKILSNIHQPHLVARQNVTFRRVGQCMSDLNSNYLGFVTPLSLFSSSVGANGSTAIIFSNISFRNFGFSLALANSSSKQVRTPILQSMIEGFTKDERQSCNCMNSEKKNQKVHSQVSIFRRNVTYGPDHLTPYNHHY